MSARRKKEATRPLQARVRESVYARAEEAAEVEHRSLTGLVTKLIEDHLNDGPMAADRVELWLLRSYRAARKKDREGWASIMRPLAARFAELGFPLEADLYEAFGSVPRKRAQQQPAAEDSSALREAAHGRAPKAH